MRNKILLTSLLLIFVFTAQAARKIRPYGTGYNFEVATDSLHAQENDPLVSIDSIGTVALSRGQTLVVARLQYVPTDSTVWVQVGTILPADSINCEEHAELVWLREKELLAHTIPDKIVTKIIHAVNVHCYLWYVITLGLLVFLVINRHLQRHPAKGEKIKETTQVMLLDHVPSPYPWFLTITVTATVVAIRLTDTAEWNSFYFSPTLNPFVAESINVSVSLGLLWFTLIVLIATVSEVFRLLPLSRAWAYTASIPSVCTLIVWLLTRV